MFENPLHTRLKLDPWSASSLLQKAIRRGENHLAQQAAAALLQYRGPGIWRRLINIAAEDVGLADPALVAEVARLATNKRLRETIGGDVELVQLVCNRLVGASKDRSADYLYSAVTRLPWAWDSIRALEGSGIASQIAVASDRRQPLFQRAVATLLAGTTRGRDGRQTINVGSVRSLVAALSTAGTPEIFEAVELIATARGHPFSLMLLPLAMELALDDQELPVSTQQLPKAQHVGSLPLYVFDKHTAIGKHAISAFASVNSQVSEVLAACVPQEKRVSVTLMAAFYVDAISVLRKLEWKCADRLLRMGFEADMLSAGCPLEVMKQVFATVRDNLDHLNELRREILLSCGKGR